MGTHSELGEFLRIRRASLQPEDVGVLNYGIRRVPGLRREELAMLAGVSTTYYTRLEQGLSTNASEAVIDAIARALNLSKDERVHLFNLARPGKTKRRTPAKPDKVRPGTLRLIQSMPGTPAVVLGRRSEVLAWNVLGTPARCRPPGLRSAGGPLHSSQHDPAVVPRRSHTGAVHALAGRGEKGGRVIAPRGGKIRR